ncbi:heme o synthase [Arsenophonus symbiont of Ornithomya chloropus]|uniref:heme o synthase n=1 Tax=Arsenophonus symbiont of Ornithomya chloropus TaxID=634121 RepID=UPI0032B2946A
MLKEYLQVIKPGIILGNLISVIGGFLLASKGNINYFLFINTLLGVSLIVASACVFNNYIDRDIDKIMERTKNRLFTKKIINIKKYLIYASILGISGIILLYINTNILSVVFSIIGFIIYVFIYSLYMKRNSLYGTIIGSLSGATPPVIGYCAVSNKCDLAALILLLIFSLWQMPHFYAIAIFHLQDYKNANIPILPVIKDIHITKNHIFLYITAFIIATTMLTITGYTGYKYLIVSTIISLYWLKISISGFKKNHNNKLWARKIFIFSLIAITFLSIMMSIDHSVSIKPILINIIL